MKTLLIVLTLVELAVLVVVLAAYLIVIAATLRNVSKTLGLITFGVRAIEKQTEPIGPVAADINKALEQVADALEGVVKPERADPGETVPGGVGSAEAGKRQGEE
jgi:uncharacterized protein YoxC